MTDQTTKFIALTPIDHDGKRYEPGQEIALADHHAEPLFKVGAIKAKAEKAPKPKDDKPEGAGKGGKPKPGDKPEGAGE